MNEQKAIEGCRRQDRICQKHVYDMHADAMLLLCMRYVKHLPDAEELMLNGFYDFFRTVDRFVYAGAGTVRPWLKKIMVNQCLMFLRKKGVLTITEDKAVEVGSTEGVLDKISADEIMKAVLVMPVGYRTVFNLFVVEGYSHKEIAEMLGIAEATSRSQLNKARAMMQQLIKEKSHCHEK